MNERWSYNLGAPAAASIAVSPDNAEIYAVTRTDVFKLIDEGDTGSLDWIATLDAFREDPDIEIEFQALTPTITANGVAITVGGGLPVQDREVMLKVGVGLLDRVTGQLRSFSLGREESIAVTSVRPDGGICTANSPVRRAGGRALNPEVAEPIVGGISCYAPARHDRLARDATCAAGVRARNAATIAESSPASAEADILQIRVLIEQARAGIERAVRDGNLDSGTAESVGRIVDDTENGLSTSNLDTVANELIRVCKTLDGNDTMP